MRTSFPVTSAETDLNHRPLKLLSSYWPQIILTYGASIIRKKIYYRLHRFRVIESQKLSRYLFAKLTWRHSASEREVIHVYKFQKGSSTIHGIDAFQLMSFAFRINRIIIMQLIILLTLLNRLLIVKESLLCSDSGADEDLLSGNNPSCAGRRSKTCVTSRNFSLMIDRLLRLVINDQNARKDSSSSCLLMDEWKSQKSHCLPSMRRSYRGARDVDEDSPSS